MTLHKLKLVQKLQIADQSKGSDMEEWFHEHLHIPEYQQLIIKHIFSKCLLKRDTGYYKTIKRYACSLYEHLSLVDLANVETEALSQWHMFLVPFCR